MNEIKSGLWIRCAVDLQSGVGQNETHKLKIFRVVVNDDQPQDRRVCAARAHDLAATAIKPSSTRRISSSRLQASRRTAVPSSKLPCVPLSPSPSPDMQSPPIPRPS